MNKDQLASLREQILADVVPLVLDSAQNGADRFGILLRVIQAGNASGELYSRAYESAKTIDDNKDRLEALLSLLDEVDFDANRENEDDVPTAQSEQLDVTNSGNEN